MILRLDTRTGEIAEDLAIHLCMDSSTEQTPASRLNLTVRCTYILTNIHVHVTLRIVAVHLGGHTLSVNPPIQSRCQHARAPGPRLQQE